MKFPLWGLALMLGLGACAPLSAVAQDSTFLGAREPDTPQVIEVGNNDLATLSLNGSGAISLRANLAGLQANPNADAVIKRWVARGNVVFLHTDAAQSFGFATARIRPTTQNQAGQEFIRTRAALPFGAHPLLRGDGRDDNSGNGTNPTADVTRLPGVRRVFGSLREGDVFVVASDVATPLLQVEDITGNGNSPALYAAAITSLGAGWAIFCPDEVDLRRGDGAAFARGLQSFIPGERGQRWVGIPTRSLTAGTLDSLASAVGARLQVSNATDGTAALPAFGVNAPPAVAPPVSEPTLPVDRDEAASLLSVVETRGVRATARIALMQARLALQNSDPNACLASLNTAAVDPALASQIDFWNALVIAQSGADTILAAPQRAAYFGQAAQALASSAVLSANYARSTEADSTARTAVIFPVPFSVVRQWSEKLARLSAISALSPPLVQPLESGDSTASIRFFPGDPNGPGLANAVAGLLQDQQFGWRAPHVEVVLMPDATAFFALRRALGRNDGNVAPDGDQVGDTILLASGTFGRGANEATLKRLWSRVLLTTWSDGARQLPPWLVAGIQGIAVGGNTPAELALVREAGRSGALSLLSNDAEGFPVVTPLQRAESSAFMDWFYDTYGVGAGTDLVARLAAGRSLSEAVEAATGDDLATVGDHWRRSLGLA